MVPHALGSALLLCLAILMFHPDPCAAQRLSPLGTTPDWSRLDAYQETISRDQFLYLLNEVFAPNEAWKAFIAVDENSALIKKEADSAAPPYVLRFRPAEAEEKAPARYWRSAAQLPTNATDERPLEGLKIALDAGHLGGRWAKMEERWFQIGTERPVTEGDMTLKVCAMLKTRLEALGASVVSLRTRPEPLTPQRPSDLLGAARQILAERGVLNGLSEALAARVIMKEAEKLFYRTSEIHARADKVNHQVKPDLVLCVHFNAEAWGDPLLPQLIDERHLHLIVNGCYSHAELSLDDVRLEMLIRLLNGSFPEELALSQSVATAMAAATGLIPFIYPGTNAKKLDESGYLWARNLLANRLYECPVIFLEPYVMNNKEDYTRIQAGAYEGLREFNGQQRKNIYTEYVDSVVLGVVDYFRKARAKP